MTADQPYKIGNWVFTPSRNVLASGEKVLHLEDRASRVLEYLCQNAGNVISKEDLIGHVWQGRHLSEQSVPVVISYLRKTFSDGGETADIIETIPKRGYRVIEAHPITFGMTGRGQNKWVMAVAAVLAVLIFSYFMLKGGESEARKPGIVLTLNDIRNATGDEGLMGQVIAMSEAGSYYLSKVDDVLLIRHWWYVEGEDPTGGIFERYGEDAPIYHIYGTLIKEGDNLSVTLFLEDPRTDEVLWSEAYAVSEDGFLSPHLSSLGKILAFLGAREMISPPGAEGLSGKAVTEYWLGLYMWHLGTEGAAKSAAARWQSALALNPEMNAAEAGLQALWARWPNLSSDNSFTLNISAEEKNPAVLVQAGAIALYQENDPEKAEQLARAALSQSPNDHAAYALLAECLVQKGDIDAGLIAIKEAQILAPFSSVYPKRAAAFLAMLESGG